MNSQRLIFRHTIVALCFILLSLLLNRPEVVFFSRIGFVAWYPAIGFVMALVVGVSPWYALLACFSVALAGRVMYAQPIISFSGAGDAAGIAICYGAAAYVLRGPGRIDLELRQRECRLHIRLDLLAGLDRGLRVLDRRLERAGRRLDECGDGGQAGTLPASKQRSRA